MNYVPSQIVILSDVNTNVFQDKKYTTQGYFEIFKYQKGNKSIPHFDKRLSMYRAV